MFLVLLIHYIPSRMTVSPETIRTNFLASLGQLELNSICFVCVNCFIIISGYFGIRWKAKSFSKFLYTILFWAIIAYALSLFIGNYFESPKNLYAGNFIQVAYVSRWFIGAYLCLYIVAPLVNSFIEKCSVRDLGRFIIVFYLFSTIYGWFLLSKNFNEGMSELSLIGLYLVGAYLKRSKLMIFSFKPTTDIIIYFGLGLVLVGVNSIIYYIGINKSVYGYLNPIIILESIYLFLFFKKIKIGYKPWINTIAASAFYAYLLHHHQYIFPYYEMLSKWVNHNVSLSLLCMIGIIISIMLFCTTIDFLGNKLFNLFYNIATTKKKMISVNPQE